MRLEASSVCSTRKWWCTLNAQNDLSALCDRAAQASATAKTTLSANERAVKELSRDIGSMPFVVRGFVSSTISSGTGQDIGGWVKTISDLTLDIDDAQDAIESVRLRGSVDQDDRAVLSTTVQHARGEQAGMERLADFLESAPGKIRTVPPGILPPDKRDEMVAMLDEQARAVRKGLAMLPDLVASLDALLDAR